MAVVVQDKCIDSRDRQPVVSKRSKIALASTSINELIEKEHFSLNGTRTAETSIYSKATKPTLCFLGKAATASWIMRIFPRWAEHLRLGDCEIRGVDLKKPSKLAAYRGRLEARHRNQFAPAVVHRHLRMVTRRLGRLRN